MAYLFKGDPGPAPSAPPNGSSRELAAEFNVVKPKANSSIHEHLEQIKTGDRVKFEAEQVDGQFTVTKINKAK